MSDKKIISQHVPKLPAGEKIKLSSGRQVYTCVLCGSIMEEHHCKVVCPSCGYFMDCSDLF